MKQRVYVFGFRSHAERIIPMAEFIVDRSFVVISIDEARNVLPRPVREKERWTAEDGDVLHSRRLADRPRARDARLTIAHLDSSLGR